MCDASRIQTEGPRIRSTECSHADASETINSLCTRYSFFLRIRMMTTTRQFLCSTGKHPVECALLQSETVSHRQSPRREMTAGKGVDHTRLYHKPHCQYETPKYVRYAGTAPKPCHSRGKSKAHRSRGTRTSHTATKSPPALAVLTLRPVPCNCLKVSWVPDQMQRVERCSRHGAFMSHLQE